MKLRARLQRLEHSRHAGPCGRDCPPVCYVYDDGWYGQPSEDEQPASCPRCGRPPVVIRVVYDPNFYGNAERLKELKT
jgi:hypothetical protein